MTDRKQQDQVLNKIQPPPGNVAAKTFFSRSSKSKSKTIDVEEPQNKTVKMSRRHSTSSTVLSMEEDSELFNSSSTHSRKAPARSYSDNHKIAPKTKRVSFVSDGPAEKQAPFKDSAPSLKPSFLSMRMALAPVAKNTIPSISPQAFLDAMIRSRGYTTTRFKTLQSAYHNKPTSFQQASYDVYLISLVRGGSMWDLKQFEKIVHAGISPNPCNAYGESLVHTICRRGRVDFLKILLDAGCELQVSDDYGRTPLHDACWSGAPTPCFEIIDMILQEGARGKTPSEHVRMFHMTDARGAVPLSYVSKHHWQDWIVYLDSVKDMYWPVRDLAKLGEEEPPTLTTMPPNSRPLVKPKDCLSDRLAAEVVSGELKPSEAVMLMYEDDLRNSWSMLGYGLETEGELEDDEDSDDEEDNTENSMFDDDELNMLLGTLCVHASG